MGMKLIRTRMLGLHVFFLQHRLYSESKCESRESSASSKVSCGCWLNSGHWGCWPGRFVDDGRTWAGPHGVRFFFSCETSSWLCQPFQKLPSWVWKCLEAVTFTQIHTDISWYILIDSSHTSKGWTSWGKLCSCRRITTSVRSAWLWWMRVYLFWGLAASRKKIWECSVRAKNTGLVQKSHALTTRHYWKHLKTESKVGLPRSGQVHSPGICCAIEGWCSLCGYGDLIVPKAFGCAWSCHSFELHISLKLQLSHALFFFVSFEAYSEYLRVSNVTSRAWLESNW